MDHQQCTKSADCVLKDGHVSYLGYVKAGLLKDQLVRIIVGKLENYYDVYTEPLPCMNREQAREYGALL